jgi:CDP-glucose 4,6-dehydratase
MDFQFWQGKKVLVTGHTGFKGGWLSLWLQKMGADVVGFSLPPATVPSLFHTANVGSGMKTVINDIRNMKALESAVREASPEIVFHLAAQALVRYSYQHPVETYNTNVMGTIHLLESLRNMPSIKAAVLITSDKCYENREWVWGYRESDPMGGYDPYSGSKGCAELAISSYRRSFFRESECSTLIASTRAGNVIGGGDWGEDRLVPDLMTSILKDEPCNIRNPHAIRPWQHVLEPLRGYLMLAQNLYIGDSSYAQAWNFGPSDKDAQPVQLIADYLCRSWGGEASWIRDNAEHPHEANYLKLDCSKAGRLLGWSPVLDLEESLDLIVQWFRAYRDGGDMKDITLDQIENYQARVA